MRDGTWGWGAAMALLVLMTPAAGSGQFVQSPAPDPENPTITALGRGIVRVPAERAILFLEISSEGAAFGPALMAGVREKRTQLTRALADIGIGEDAISPWGLGTSVAGGMGRPQVGGAPQVATEGIRVVVEEAERASQVAEAALAGGATRIAGLVYEPGDNPEARAQAATTAMAQARAEAEAVALAAGGRLGPLISVSTSPDYSAITSTSVMMSGFVRGGELAVQDPAISLSLSASWRFLPGQN